MSQLPSWLTLPSLSARFVLYPLHTATAESAHLLPLVRAVAGVVALLGVGMAIAAAPQPHDRSGDSRRYPDPRDALQSMPKVQLQLVLQFLDSESRVKAARCSRTMLIAVDDPFVWRYGGAVVRLRGPPPPPSLGARILAALCRRPADPDRLESSLLRRAPTALRIDSPEELARLDVAAVPRLRELLLYCVCPDETVTDLLAHPALEELHTLRLQDAAPASALQAAVALPLLHSLSVDCRFTSVDFSPLRRAPALTALDVRLGGTRILTHISALGQLVQLRSLRLRGRISAEFLLVDLRSSATLT